MTETTNSIELNLKEDYSYKYLYAKQYDKKSRYVKAKIYDGEQLLTISPEDTIVRIRCTKPDKTYVLYDVEQANIKDNTIRFELTEQMLAKEGTVRCDIGLYTTLVNKETLVKEGESLISTAVFYINVEKAGYSEDAICSSSEFSALTNALIKVEEAAKITEEARLATKMTNKAREEIEESFADIEGRFEYIENTTGSTVDASLAAIESAKQAKISETNAKQSEISADNSASIAFQEAERAKFYSEEAENSSLDAAGTKITIDKTLSDFNANINSFRQKTDPIVKSDLGTNLQNEINAKAEQADTRLKSDAITEADLDYALAQKVNNGGGSGGGAVIISGAEIDDTSPSHNKTYSSQHTEDRIKTEIKSAVSGIDLSGGITASERKKLAGIEKGANNYIHPLYHPPEIINETTSKQFISQIEKDLYANKYTKEEVDNIISSLATGIIWKPAVAAYADIAAAYPNPQSNWAVQTDSEGSFLYDGKKWIKFGSGSVPLATFTTDGLLSSALYQKLTNIETSANHYIHPSTHPAAMISEDSTHRFVTDVMIDTIKDLDTTIKTSLADYRKKTEKIEKYDLANDLVQEISAASGQSIDDSIISSVKGYSSSKIEGMLKSLATESEMDAIFSSVFPA